MSDHDSHLLGLHGLVGLMAVLSLAAGVLCAWAGWTA